MIGSGAVKKCVPLNKWLSCVLVFVFNVSCLHPENDIKNDMYTIYKEARFIVQCTQSFYKCTFAIFLSLAFTEMWRCWILNFILISLQCEDGWKMCLLDMFSDSPYRLTLHISYLAVVAFYRLSYTTLYL